jgi:hypothetical protein
MASEMRSVKRNLFVTNKDHYMRLSPLVFTVKESEHRIHLGSMKTCDFQQAVTPVLFQCIHPAHYTIEQPCTEVKIHHIQHQYINISRAVPHNEMRTFNGF